MRMLKEDEINLTSFYSCHTADVGALLKSVSGAWNCRTPRVCILCKTEIFTHSYVKNTRNLPMNVRYNCTIFIIVYALQVIPLMSRPHDKEYYYCSNDQNLKWKFQLFVSIGIFLFIANGSSLSLQRTSEKYEKHSKSSTPPICPNNIRWTFSVSNRGHQSSLLWSNRGSWNLGTPYLLSNSRM